MSESVEYAQMWIGRPSIQRTVGELVDEKIVGRPDIKFPHLWRRMQRTVGEWGPASPAADTEADYETKLNALGSSSNPADPRYWN